MKLNTVIAHTLNVYLKYHRSSRTNKKHIIFVVIASAGLRFAQLFLPFRWTSHWLGQHKGNTRLSVIASKTQTQRAYKTGRFISNVCKQTPWQSKCFVQAGILRIYLDHYQIPYVLHLGLAKDKSKPDKPLIAHAWVNVGRYTVIGGDGHDNFTIMATYVPNSLTGPSF